MSKGPIPNIGDVVVLKSGGPKMTVGAIESEYGVPMVRRVWFEENSLNR
jgi:uncharacterized protein YodC (DUF2158 family)